MYQSICCGVGPLAKFIINYELEPFNIQVVSDNNTGDIRLEDKLAGAYKLHNLSIFPNFFP
jgi:hypothetical protein